MTIAGIVARRDYAVVWSDTETFDKRDLPSGHQNKLAVNAAGGFAVTGAGWCALSRAGADVAASARDLDEAAPRIGAALRAKAERIARDPWQDPHRIAAHIEFLAGWSPSLGRVVGYELRGDALFLPRLTTRAAAPWVPELDALDPENPRAIADLARRQLEVLREDYPEARGGVLTVAVLRPGQITAGPLLDLTNNEWLWPGLRSEWERIEEMADG